MNTRIHAVQTGSVQVKKAQRVRKPGGLVRVLTDTEWTEWLPIYVWVIEHAEGIIVVDTGESSRTREAAYFPAWHPYYRTSVRMDVNPEEEIGPQLRGMGIREQDVRTLVMTHFHTDHSGGLRHFPQSDILVSGDDWNLATGLAGRLVGYLPHRWPNWLSPTPIAFERQPLGPFARSYPVTRSGDVVIVPTPGHTPNHVSVIVQSDGLHYLLAGDTSYDQRLLLERTADGVSPKADVTLATIDRILGFSAERPTVYLPSHDPDSASRLAAMTTVGEAAVAVDSILAADQ